MSGQDWLISYKDDEWGNILNNKADKTSRVVLRDRLMTDAAIDGPRPIKTEHSYSLSAYSPPASPQPTVEKPQIRIPGPVSAGNASATSNATDSHQKLGLGTKIDGRV